MKKESAYKKIKQANCDVCGNSVWLDQYGNGDECPVCGWRQSEESAAHPDGAGIMNIPSLNSARELYRQGKRLVANFDDFIEAYKRYGELEFTYKGVVYGVYAPRGTIILFESYRSSNDIGHYKNIEDFRNNASINGVLLKDLWSDVENTDFLQ